MTHSSEQVVLSSSAAAAHGSFATTSTAAGTAAGTTVVVTASVSAKTTRKSRGSGGLQPDFVFPKPSSVGLETKLDSLSFRDTTPSSDPRGDSNKRLSVTISGCENGSLASKTQQHLKTHYRTHSRNGSTVTVQDLKQAIAAVQTGLLEMTPLTVVSSSTGTSSGSINTETQASEPLERSSPAIPPDQEISQDAASQPDRSLALQVDLAKQLPALDSASSAPSTPLRDSYAVPLFSPVSSRPNATRDRPNMSVPPFFAYSIPHELPSPYNAPRLLLPGSAGPTPLPISPFARKRKHAYHHSPAAFPSSTITVKLPGQNESVNCSHHQSVGSVPDIELVDYDFEDGDVFVEHETDEASPLPLVVEEMSHLAANSRARKPLPPPLNLSGNSSSESGGKSTPVSPITPTTSNRRQRSRRRSKNRNSDSTQVHDVGKESADQLMENSVNDKKSGEADQPKTRSKSRSSSRSRAHADSGSNQGSSSMSVPPVPQTPSWVPTHNMTLASAGPPSTTGTAPTCLSAPAPVIEPLSPSALVPPSLTELPMSPASALAPRSPSTNSTTESDLKRRGPRPARLLNTRPTNGHQTWNEDGQGVFTPRSARDGSSDYFSMRPLQHPPRTPMTPGGDFGDDEDGYYGRLQVTTPMIQNGFFPNWAKGDAQLEELERIRLFLAARQYPDEMPLSDEW